MRSLALLPALALGGVLAAQPVLSYDNLGLVGSVYDLYAIVDPGDCDFDLEGQGVYWDLNTAIIDLIGGAVFTLPQNTPYAGDYPEADVALLAIFNGDSSYSYYDVTPAGISMLASGVGGPFETIYADPSTFLVFPLSYGGVFNDDYTEDGTPWSVTRTCTGDGTFEIIGYITDNVVKVTSSNGEKDWYRSDPVEPLLHITPTNGKTYWERITIGMAEQRGLLPLTLAPNPASTFFRIPGLSAAANYRLMDAQGRVVLTGRAAGAQDVIDVAALPAGIYKLQVIDQRGPRVATMLKD